MLCLPIWGCAGVTLGPQVRTEYTILHPGRPMQVLDGITVQGRALDGSGDAVRQDVGGWIMMPPDHWAAIQRALERPPLMEEHSETPMRTPKGSSF